MERARILVADDEESIRFLLREVMTREGYEVVTVANGAEAVREARANEFDLAILDVKMPELDGMGALKELRLSRPGMVVLMMTAFGTNAMGMEAVRLGAYDFFTKPFELDEMRIIVRRALEKQSLVRRVAGLEERLRDRASFDRIIGRSDAMREVFSLLEKVVGNDVTVLVTGESGTGKELVAQAVHYQSPRKSKPFVGVNCAAIPEALLESELFGHERGAFTGAVGTKIGRFEAADGGSIFLDEIGEMPLALQSKMLRVLQEREIQRVGGNKAIKVDIRVIAATNRRLEDLVAAKAFREDLFFRLNVVSVRLPPLRARRADIGPLASHFIGVHNARLGKNVEGMTPEVLAALENYPWPGNVRELENVIQRCMILGTGPVIQREALPGYVLTAPPAPGFGADDSSWSAAGGVSGGGGLGAGGAAGGGPAGSGAGAMHPAFLEDFTMPMADKIEKVAEDMERRIISAALEKANHRRQDTADLLGISRKSLHNKMVKYSLFGERGGTDSDE